MMSAMVYAIGCHYRTKSCGVDSLSCGWSPWNDLTLSLWSRSSLLSVDLNSRPFPSTSQTVYGVC